jgi:5-methylcytosine-specific restriction endonuclease McrA
VFNRPCLDCGVLTNKNNRCEKHQAIYQANIDAKKASKRAHYKGDYQTRAKQVRDSASICWLCGKGYRDGDPWTADHVVPAQADSVLLPAHRSCNSSRGNKEPKKIN